MWHKHLLYSCLVLLKSGVLSVKMHYSKTDEMDVLTINMGKPVISRYGRMENKIQEWWISNRVYQVPFTEKRPQNAHTGIKNVLEQKGERISLWNIPAGKQDYLFRHSVAPGNSPLKRPKKSCSFSFLTGISGSFLWIVNVFPPGYSRRLAWEQRTFGRTFGG